jgi:predicted DNA-binding protein
MRKNFTMPQNVAHDLEYLARMMHKKQSQVVQELIEEKMQQVRKVQRKEAIERLSGLFSGEIGEEVDMQWIKAHSGA